MAVNVSTNANWIDDGKVAKCVGCSLDCGICKTVRDSMKDNLPIFLERTGVNVPDGEGLEVTRSMLEKLMGVSEEVGWMAGYAMAIYVVKRHQGRFSGHLCEFHRSMLNLTIQVCDQPPTSTTDKDTN